MADKRLGQPLDQLDTPVLVLNLDRMQDNINTMVDTCHQHGIQWRPHAKCHKSARIAQRLVNAGAVGVTCAKLGEAEVMAAGGVRDLLIANMIVGPQKIDRVVQLTASADPVLVIDHLDQAIPLAHAMDAVGREVRVIIELDIGMQRVGVTPGEPVVTLAQQVSQLAGIRFSGLMAYEGHLLTVPDPIAKRQQIHEALGLMTSSVEQLSKQGLQCDIVSCGGTGSYRITAAVPGITEIQAGGAIFMDAFYRHACNVKSLQDALTVLSTVVSRPAADRAVIDAGRKTLNGEIYMPRVCGRDDVHVDSLSAEHGKLSLDPSARSLSIGDRVELLPGYADLTVNLHHEFVGYRDGTVVEVIPIEARGYVR